MIKRIISSLLCICMIISLAISGAGCDGGDKKEELITLDVYSQTANWSGLQTGWYAALLKDKFNVQINIIRDEDGTYETRTEAGDLGDIIVWGQNGWEYKNAVELGLLYDWEEDDLCKESAPTIWANAQTALECNREISGDGKVHGIGYNLAASVEDHESFFYTWDIRWDLYKEIGYPEVTDLDSYVEVMKKMKEVCPTDDIGNETYAVSLWPDWDGTMVMYVKAMATAYYGYDELTAGLYDPITGELHDTLEEGGPYLTCLKFFNNLYQNDLLDPDSMTQTFDQMAEKVKNGGTFFSIFNYSGSIAYNTEEHMEAGKMMSSLVPSEAIPSAYGMSVLGGNRIWSIGADAEYPELCMEILEWLYTPDGAMSIWYGLRDLNWYYDEAGNTCFTELGMNCHNDPQFDMAGVEWTSPYSGKKYTLGATFNDGMLQINNTSWSIDSQNPDSNGETYNWETWRSMQGDAKYDIELDWREFVGYDYKQDYMESLPYNVMPGTSYSESVRSDELEVTWKQVTTCLKTYSWRAIYAESDKEFDYHVSEMIRLCNEYGYADIVAWSEGEAAIRFALQQELVIADN